MNNDKIIIDINKLNTLINNTVDALNEIITSEHATEEHILQAAVVVKKLQQSINKNGLKLAMNSLKLARKKDLSRTANY